jgi:predicted NBD/HSP70 family sugar kinase
MYAILGGAGTGQVSRRVRRKSRIAALLVAGVVTSVVAVAAPNPLGVSAAQASPRGVGVGASGRVWRGGWVLLERGPWWLHAPEGRLTFELRQRVRVWPGQRHEQPG